MLDMGKLLLLPLGLFVATMVMRNKRRHTSPTLPEERGNYIEGPLLSGEVITNGVIATYGQLTSNEDLRFFAERMFSDATDNPGLMFQIVYDENLSHYTFWAVVDGENTVFFSEDPLEANEAYEEALATAVLGPVEE